MARTPVSVYKRPTTKKGKYRWYVAVWEDERGDYSTARSAEQLVIEYNLDPKEYPPTNRAGALRIGMELLRRGGLVRRKDMPLYADYCARFWDWDTSEYVQGKLARDQRIGREYVLHNAAYVRNYIRPAFPAARLSEVKTHMLEDFAMKLKRESGLSHRSINAILMAATIPLGEAARLDFIPKNPALKMRRFGVTTQEKGIPTDEEVQKLTDLPGLDPRVRCAIYLGAFSGLRLGEVLALRREDIGQDRIHVRHSWGKEEGLKCPKNGKARESGLLPPVRAALLELADVNPHGPDGFLLYGKIAEKPLDFRALERGFYKALERIGIPESERRIRGISFHSLRHWFNARMRSRIPDAKLRLLTGHTTASMTDHYDHITDSDRQDLHRALETAMLPLIDPH